MHIHIAYGDREAAEQIRTALSAYEVDCTLSDTDDRQSLSAADVLILAVNDATQLDKLQAVWRYFVGEIEWKRKPDASLFVYASAPLKSAYVPFRLKRFPLFTDLDDLVEAFDDTDGQEEQPAKPQEPPRVAPPEQIRYTPSPVDQPQKPRQSNACKLDHVFDDIPDDRPPEKPQDNKLLKKATGIGCFLIALIVGVVIFFSIFPFIL